jgi:transposase
MAGGNFLTFWTELFQLPGFEVMHVYEDSYLKRLFVTVVPKHAVGVCPHCGQVCDDVKQRRTREGIQDLPIGRNAVELKVRVDQLECRSCGHCFTPPLAFLAEGSHATERFLERAAELIRQSDVLNASRFLGVAEKTLDDWYYDYVERQQQQAVTASAKPIRRLGIDEVSLKKSSASSSP